MYAASDLSFMRRSRSGRPLVATSGVGCWQAQVGRVGGRRIAGSAAARLVRSTNGVGQRPVVAGESLCSG